jgi:hypothetical protein
MFRPFSPIITGHKITTKHYFIPSAKTETQQMLEKSFNAIKTQANKDSPLNTAQSLWARKINNSVQILVTSLYFLFQLF